MPSASGSTGRSRKRSPRSRGSDPAAGHEKDTAAGRGSRTMWQVPPCGEPAPAPASRPRLPATRWATATARPVTPRSRPDPSNEKDGRPKLVAAQERTHARRTLGENLERVARRSCHDTEHAGHEVVRHLVGVHEQVGHAVDEHSPGFAPLQGLLQPVRPQPHVEALLKRVLWHTAPPLGERPGVAVIAAFGYFAAPGGRVPGRAGRSVVAPRPLDLRRGAQDQLTA